MGNPIGSNLSANVTKALMSAAYKQDGQLLEDSTEARAARVAQEIIGPTSIGHPVKVEVIRDDGHGPLLAERRVTPKKGGSWLTKLFSSKEVSYLLPPKEGLTEEQRIQIKEQYLLHTPDGKTYDATDKLQVAEFAKAMHANNQLIATPGSGWRYIDHQKARIVIVPQRPDGRPNFDRAESYTITEIESGALVTDNKRLDEMAFKLTCAHQEIEEGWVNAKQKMAQTFLADNKTRKFLEAQTEELASLVGFAKIELLLNNRAEQILQEISDKNIEIHFAPEPQKHGLVEQLKQLHKDEDFLRQQLGRLSKNPPTGKIPMLEQQLLQAAGDPNKYAVITLELRAAKQELGAVLDAHYRPYTSNAKRIPCLRSDKLQAYSGKLGASLFTHNKDEAIQLHQAGALAQELHTFIKTREQEIESIQGAPEKLAAMKNLLQLQAHANAFATHYKEIEPPLSLDIDDLSTADGSMGFFAVEEGDEGTASISPADEAELSLSELATYGEVAASDLAYDDAGVHGEYIDIAGRETEEDDGDAASTTSIDESEIIYDVPNTSLGNVEFALDDARDIPMTSENLETATQLAQFARKFNNLSAIEQKMTRDKKEFVSNLKDVLHEALADPDDENKRQEAEDQLKHATEVIHKQLEDLEENHPHDINAIARQKLLVDALADVQPIDIEVASNGSPILLSSAARFLVGQQIKGADKIPLWQIDSNLLTLNYLKLKHADQQDIFTDHYQEALTKNQAFKENSSSIEKNIQIETNILKEYEKHCSELRSLNQQEQAGALPLGMSQASFDDMFASTQAKAGFELSRLFHSYTDLDNYENALKELESDFVSTTRYDVRAQFEAALADLDYNHVVFDPKNKEIIVSTASLVAKNGQLRFNADLRKQGVRIKLTKPLQELLFPSSAESKPPPQGPPPQGGA